MTKCTLQGIAEEKLAQENTMQFSVIYSVDIPQGISIKNFAPPQVGRLWTLTEGDQQYEYSYLEGRWEKGRHRKWTALLNRSSSMPS